MARFSGSYTALLKKLFRVCIERLVLANLLTKSFTAFRYAPFSNSFQNELRPNGMNKSASNPSDLQTNRTVLLHYEGTNRAFKQRRSYLSLSGGLSMRQFRR